MAGQTAAKGPAVMVLSQAEQDCVSALVNLGASRVRGDCGEESGGGGWRGGFEPLFRRRWSCCDSPETGGRHGLRTHDPRVANAVLSQLS